MTNNANDKVKALEKAVKILDIIRDAKYPLGVNEISRLCSVSVTTSFRILQTLKCSGWVYQNDDDKYIIGHKISFVTEKNNFYIALKEIAYYTMSRLSAETSQAMNLVVRENNKGIILQQSRTDKFMDYVPPIGTVLPLYASACGKVLLSEIPITIRDEILNSIVFTPLTQYTITDRNVLIKNLEDCRTHGYALDDRESQEIGFCIAVPVRFDGGEIVASLSFSGITGSIKSNSIDKHLKLLQEGSQEISTNLSKLDKEIGIKRIIPDDITLFT